MMRRFFSKAISVTFLMISSVLSGFAWDDVGHKITSYIAWQRMTPQARENVIKILRSAPEDSQLATFYMSYGAEPEEIRRRTYFMLVSTWADIVRDRAFENRYKKYHKGNWHFSDTFWRQVNGKVEILTGFEEGGQGVTRLFEAEKTLRDARSSGAEKALAVAWFMHIGGDLHQPLHTSARVTELEQKGDQGGNLFLLSPPGTARINQVNLHWFWDSITGRNIRLRGDICERTYIEPIARMIIKKHPFTSVQSKLKLSKYDEWQKESFVLNTTDVFSPDLVRFQIPSEKYRKNAFRVAQQQFATAGYRLGETLNDIFGKTVTP